MNSINLTPDEIKEVTGKTVRKLQIDVLMQLDIPFKIRPDSTIIISREAYQAAMGLTLSQEPVITIKPDFAAMGR